MPPYEAVRNSIWWWQTILSNGKEESVVIGICKRHEEVQSNVKQWQAACKDGMQHQEVVNNIKQWQAVVRYLLFGPQKSDMPQGRATLYISRNFLCVLLPLKGHLWHE